MLLTAFCFQLCSRMSEVVLAALFLPAIYNPMKMITFSLCHCCTVSPFHHFTVSLFRYFTVSPSRCPAVSLPSRGCACKRGGDSTFFPSSPTRLLSSYTFSSASHSLAPKLFFCAHILPPSLLSTLARVTTMAQPPFLARVSFTKWPGYTKYGVVALLLVFFSLCGQLANVICYYTLLRRSPKALECWNKDAAKYQLQPLPLTLVSSSKVNNALPAFTLYSHQDLSYIYHIPHTAKQ